MYAKLFDANGAEVALLDAGKLIAQTFNRRHLLRQFPQAGTYWFVWDCSDDPQDKRGTGFYQISIHEVRPGERQRRASYGLYGANYPHFDLEAAIRPHVEEPLFGPKMPANVEAIVREHVRYVDSTELHTEGENNFTILTRKPADLAARVHKLTDKDATQLGEQLGGRHVPVFELALQVTTFAVENDIEDKLVLTACMYATVSLRRKLRLWKLLRALGSRLAQD